MRQFVKRHKLLLAILAAPILVYLLFLVLLFGRVLIIRIHNEIRLQNFAPPFLEYPLPPQTVEVSRSARAGWLSTGGNADRCEFEVSRTLRTELSRTEIEAYYVQVGFPPVFPESQHVTVWGANGKIRVDVVFDETQTDVVTISIFDGWYESDFWDFTCL
jgi:hypothetical protein